ncbi:MULTISPECIES: DNA methyltransferase [Actinomadura]|uniref:DNA methyltransferase n=1 Tax=Actinomadura yumaensis TaxID=111807 RepID=A0ABW2CIE3_9ACTN|nr:DNA methyltransferase [Actinomadura sp. J1-007]MWK37169.1 hypothetical protein [Actinomadura sp. J1-007]
MPGIGQQRLQPTGPDLAVHHRGTAAASRILATGQKPSRLQRQGRYVPEAMKHPARMLPAIAAQVIASYSRPRELVADPMCGIGTTLVEAIHLDRHAVGVEYEEGFAHLTARNIQHARSQGAPGHAS